MRSLIQFFVGICACTSAALGYFDFTVTGYVDSTFNLNNQSLLVNGDGIQKIVGRGTSYIEVQSTLPLQEHIGGIGQIDLWDTGSMNLYGGEVDTVSVSGTATINVAGGSISNRLSPNSNSAVSISAGYVELLYVNGHSAVTVSGGEIGSVTVGLNVSQDAFITFICDLTSLNYTYAQEKLVGINGRWLDGSNFDIEVKNQGYLPTSDYLQFVPEPATLLLMALGGLIVYRRRD